MGLSSLEGLVRGASAFMLKNASCGRAFWNISILESTGVLGDMADCGTISMRSLGGPAEGERTILLVGGGWGYLFE